MDKRLTTKARKAVMAIINDKVNQNEVLIMMGCDIDEALSGDKREAEKMKQYEPYADAAIEDLLLWLRLEKQR